MTTISPSRSLQDIAGPNTPLIPTGPGPGPAPVSRWRRWVRSTAGRVYLERPARNARRHWLDSHAKLRRRSHVAALVLEYLLEHANAQHESWASQRRMADACSASVRQVRKVLQALQEDGMVAILPGRGVVGPSGYVTNRYRVLIRECECGAAYDQNGRPRPEFGRAESVLEMAKLSTGRNSGPANRLTPPVNQIRPGLNPCRRSRSGLHRPGPDGFCYACGYRP